MSNRNSNIIRAALVALLLQFLLLRVESNAVNQQQIVFLNDEEKNAVQHITTNQTHSLSAALQYTLNEFEFIFEKILLIFDTNVPKITQNAEMVIEKLTNRTLDTLELFSNRIRDTRHYILNDMFISLEDKMEEVKNEFLTLAVTVDDHFEWAVDTLNQTLINNTVEYDWWTAYIKHKLRNINDTQVYQEGCKTIDDFIFNSSKELQNCCKITMKPMRSMCKNAGALLTEAMHTIVDVIDRLQTCIEDKKSYSEYLIPCIDIAYNDISGLMMRVAQIRHEVNSILPMKIIYTKNCFAIVMIDMKHRRNTIERNLFLRRKQ